VTRIVALSLTLLIIVSGCVVQPVSEPPEQPVESPIGRLLAAAELNYSSNQLTTPHDNNALQKYRMVLKREPGNTRALDGINRIVEKYLAWARDHAEQRNIGKARMYVARAETVDASHPNIKPVVNLINDREDQKTTLFTLSRNDVLARDAARIAFDTIARHITRNQSFATIRAPDDASGRWIYQELNARVPFRVEAAFEVQNTPSVLLSR
jgi:hypothetical protein